MDADLSPFQFDYVSTRIEFGRDCVAGLGATMDDHGLSRALVVCGTNVGANRAVMEPVETGLGDRLVDVFAETTPAKDIEMVLAGAEQLRETEADVVVAVGAGSSMAAARAMGAIAPLSMSDDEIVASTRENGAVPTPEPPTDPVPVVTVPTTMAGADLASSGGVMLTDESDGPTSGGRSVRAGDPRLMPLAGYFDPALFATTPMGVLASSAMNGFDKGIETVYSRAASPPAVAHALHGLRSLHDGLLELRQASPDDRAFDRVALGMALVQYGRKTNVIHTFGNGVSFHYDVQQGTVHGIMAPHVLRYVFDRVDAGRHLIAGSLGIETAGRADAVIAEAIVETVAAVRDALGMPDRLRGIEGLEREALPAVADVIAANYKHARNPPGLDPTAEEVLEVLEAAW